MRNILNKVPVWLTVVAIVFGFAVVAWAAPTVVNQPTSILPTATRTYDLGTSTKEWNGIYTKDITVTGTCTGCGSGSLSGGTAGMMASWVNGTTLTSTSSPTVARIIATSTLASLFPYASTTAITSTTASTTNFIISTINSALIKTGADGTASAYTGTAPCAANQAIVSLSALAVGTCTATFATAATTVTINGTTNQITSSAGAQDLSANRTWTLSFPTLIVQPNASTTLFSNFKVAYFGGTATTTIDTAGNVVIPSGSNLTITGKTDGCATFATGVLNSTGSACGSGGGASTDFTFGVSNFGTTTAATTSSIFTKGAFYSSSTIATSTNAGDFFIGSPQVQPNPLLVIATSSRAPFYGRIPGDGIVLELDWNNNSAINAVNSAVGTCANAGFFADGNSPTLTGYLGYFGFLNDGWTGVNCPIGNIPGPRAESVLIWNPTGDIDVVVSSTTSAFNVLVGGNYATSTVMTASTTGFKINDKYSTNVMTVNTASTTWPYNLLEGWSATSTGPIFAVDSAGHVMASSTYPTLSSCGTSPSLSNDSSDFSGTITVGSVSASGCTLTFGNAHTVETHCVISNQNMSVVNAMTYTESTSGFVVSETGLTSAKLDYICTGK